MTEFKRPDSALAHYARRLREIATPEVASRAGRTTELRHEHFSIELPLDREILNPARKANIVAQIAETMWVLAGRNDIEWLSHYLSRAADFSDDGETWRAGYGPRLRHWPSDHGMVDQLAEVVKLLTEDRMTRRAVISIYDPSRDTGVSSKDIPCNNWLSFSCREGYLDLHVAIRSNDLVWGWSGINQFEWSVLLEIVAGLVGVKVGGIHYAVTSLHAYERHWSRLDAIAEAQTDIRLGHESPRFDFEGGSVSDLDELIEHWFRLEYDIRTGSPLVTGYVNEFPEPMMRSWLRILQWWWSAGNRSYLAPLEGTRLYEAAMVGVQPKRPEKKDWSQLAAGPLFDNTDTRFLDFVIALHTEKDAAYGNSWKKRGELVSILANIARKVDRLGEKETSDETSADTAIDLLVYLAKYRWWLFKGDDGNTLEGENRTIRNARVLTTRAPYRTMPDVRIVETLKAGFEELFEQAEAKRPTRYEIVDRMLGASYEIAQRLWHAEQNKTRHWNPEV